MASFKCDACRDRGIIIRGNTAVPCSCTEKRALIKRYKNSCMPEALKENTFKNFSLHYYAENKLDHVTGISYYNLAQNAYRGARQFVKDFVQKPYREGLLFSGPVGSGKTYLACCIANELLGKGHNLLFVVVPDLLDMIRATYNTPREELVHTEQELLDTAREIPLLILDDLGVHNYTEWTKNKLYSIINYRLNSRLPTIITTNISLEDLEEYIGERTTSRILQMCRPYRLTVDMDIRVLKRKQSQ